MTEIDKLAWLLIKNKQLLVVRSKSNDAYYIPGGKRDAGESDHEALIREIKEELSVDIVPETILYAGVFKAQAHGKIDGTFVKMTCYFADFVGEIKPDSEIEEILWVKHEDQENCSLVTRMIMDWLYAAGKIV